MVSLLHFSVCCDIFCLFQVLLQTNYFYNNCSKKSFFCIRVISAAGLGYGLVSGAFATVNIYRDLNGPGTVGIEGDSQYFFLITCKCFPISILVSHATNYIYYYIILFL